MKQKKIFIVGGSGTIGEAILKMLSFETDFEIVATCSNGESPYSGDNVKIYFLKSNQFKELRKAILEEKPNVIVNAAGISDPIFAENNRKLAWEINVQLVEHLVSLSKILQSHFVTFSCEWIFDGKNGPYLETDRPNPINYLGKSKLAAENLIQTTLSTFTIIRLPLIYGLYGKEDFVKRVLFPKQKDGITFPFQYTTNPVLADDVAFGIMKVIEIELFGIYHFGGADIYSINNFISSIREKIKPELFKQKKINNTEVSIIYQKNYKKKFGLQPTLTEALLSIKFSSVASGINTYLAQLIKNNSELSDGFEMLKRLI